MKKSKQKKSELDEIKQDIKKVLGAVYDLAESVDYKFDLVDKRFESIEYRIGRVEDQLEKMRITIKDNVFRRLDRLENLAI